MITWLINMIIVRYGPVQYGMVWYHLVWICLALKTTILGGRSGVVVVVGLEKLGLRLAQPSLAWIGTGAELGNKEELKSYWFDLFNKIYIKSCY